MDYKTEVWEQRAPGEPLSAVIRSLPIGPLDAVVRVAACGVCHTDLGFLDGDVTPRGPRPLVPGHEISGTVVHAPISAQALVERQVIVPAVWPCGECELCKSGRPNACPNQKMPGNDVPGGFARHVVVPARLLTVLPSPVSQARLQELAVIADAIATPYEAITRAHLTAGDLVVVVGVGGLGGFLVQMAAARGAKVIALDVSKEKLHVASSYGAKVIIDVRGIDDRELKKKVKAAAAELGASNFGWKVFETSGTTAGQKTAYDLLSPAGTLGVIGFTRDKIELRLSNLMALDATAFGVWGCRPDLYRGALEMVLKNEINVSEMVERFPLSEVNQVIKKSHEGRLTRRAVLVPDLAREGDLG